MSEKTEEPTAGRIEEMRRKGDVPKGRMLGMLAMLIALWAAGGTIVEAAAELRGWTEKLFSLGSTGFSDAMHEAFGLMAKLSVPPAVCCLVISLGLGLMNTKFLFMPALAAPNWSRVGLATGLKKTFSREQLVEVLRGHAFGVGAVVVSVAASWEVFGLSWPMGLQIEVRNLGSSRTLTNIIFSRSAACFFVWAVIESGLFVWLHRKNMKMTREELKREIKQADGDPRMKSLRRARHRELGAMGFRRGVAHAAVVVVNPTHLAVAVRYDSRDCEVPYLVERGWGDDATRIRGEAARANIPIIRDIPLARSLIGFGVGEEIPEELYEAMAIVLCCAERQRERTRT